MGERADSEPVLDALAELEATGVEETIFRAVLQQLTERGSELTAERLQTELDELMTERRVRSSDWRPGGARYNLARKERQQRGLPVDPYKAVRDRAHAEWSTQQAQELKMRRLFEWDGVGEDAIREHVIKALMNLDGRGRALALRDQLVEVLSQYARRTTPPFDGPLDQAIWALNGARVVDVVELGGVAYYRLSKRTREFFAGIEATERENMAAIQERLSSW